MDGHSNETVSGTHKLSVNDSMEHWFGVCVCVNGRGVSGNTE